MEYKKIKKDNYTLHIIKTDKFKTINIRINFKRRIKKNEITIRKFLNDLLISTSKKYKSEREIEIETEELYDLGISSCPYNSGNYHIMSFKEKFLNEKYTENGMNERSIRFLLELIFNQDNEKSLFNEKSFMNVKNIMEENIKSIKDNPKRYSLMRLYEEMSKGPISYRNIGYLEDLDKITNDNIYDYYLDVIKKDKIDIFIIGDINKEYIELFDKYIPNSIRNEEEISHFIELEDNEFKETKERMEINQSKLSIGLKLNDISEFELKYVLSIYSLILGGTSNSKLFKVVREENSLCYYINSSPSIISKTITITAGINKNDYKKTIELIKNILDDIKNGNFTNEEIEEAKKVYIAGCNEVYDSPNTIISNYLSHEYADVDLVEERKKKIQLVKKDHIISLANKIELKTIFLLEGEQEDEETEN